MFENVTFDSLKIAEIARNHLSDYQEAALQRPQAIRRTDEGRWEPPELGYFKINSDAACRADWGIGMGGILRDEKSEVCWVMADCRDASISVEVAEASAVRMGVLVAKEKAV